MFEDMLTQVQNSSTPEQVQKQPVGGSRLSSLISCLDSRPQNIRRSLTTKRVAGDLCKNSIKPVREAE